MALFDLNQVDFEVVKGRKRKLVIGENVEMALVEREAGAGDSHSHPSEQMVFFLEGRGEFHIGGETREVGAGQILHLPANVPHGITPHTFMRYVTVYTPVRDASRKGAEEGRTGHFSSR